MAKAFSLPDQDGKQVSLSDLQGKIVVLEWFNDGCPFVQRHYRLGTMKNLADKYKDVLPDLAEGKPLPEFALEDLAGKKIKSGDLRGKVVVLCFLTTTDERTAAIRPCRS